MANERKNNIDEINEDMSHVTTTKGHNKNNTDEALLVNALNYFNLGTDSMRTPSTARAQILSSACPIRSSRLCRINNWSKKKKIFY